MLQIFVAFIAGMATIVVASGNNHSRYVTGDREKWRDFIRVWIKKTTILIYDGKNANQLETQKSEIILRLNPNRDLVLRNQINNLSVNSLDKVKDLNIVIDSLQKLLKHEWEKIKKGHSLLGGSYFLNISLIALLGWYLYKANNYTNIEIISINIKYALSLIFILLGKLLVVELEKIPYLRDKASINIFDNFNHSINLPSLIELYVMVGAFILGYFITREIEIFIIPSALVIFYITLRTILKKNCWRD